MKKRFSSHELFELRNAIPVRRLIRDELQIPSKISEGVFRFLCPVCHEFQTATHPATNLARCFRCEKNFNTIDLVMAVKGLDFKESVVFLGILQIEGKVVYTFWQAVFRQSSGTSHNGGFSFFFCAGSYTGEREKDLSFSRMTSKSRSTQSFFCFFPVNISMGVWFFLLPAL